MERKLTCIICPLGCELTVKLENEKVISVSGNTCKRGEIYAQNECTNPQRTVTSTVLCSDGGLVAVKTDGTIPKDKVFDCMEIINKIVAPLPVKIGDVLASDVFGVNVVATANRGVK
jgi:CxxC motif-containing protein